MTQIMNGHLSVRYGCAHCDKTFGNELKAREHVNEEHL